MITSNDKPEPPMERYGCFIGGWPILIPPAASSEVLPPQPIHALPHSTPLFPGLIERRGRPVPVFDLRPLCRQKAKVPASLPTSTCFLVFGRGREAIGLCMDDLPTSLMHLQPAKAPDDLPDILRTCLRSSYTASRRHWLEIDRNELFRQILRTASTPRIQKARYS